MKTVTVELYEYNELDDKAKERARDWYRSASVGDDVWSQGPLETGKEYLELFGFADVEIFYSGFCSQGDGASFTGTWTHTMYPRFATLTSAAWLERNECKDAALISIAEEFDRVRAMANDNTRVRVYRGHLSNFYSHSNTAGFEFDDDNDSETFEQDFTAVSRRMMDYIYADLEAAYNYEQSDETVEANIEANEYTFRKNGERSDG